MVFAKDPDVDLRGAEDSTRTRSGSDETSTLLRTSKSRISSNDRSEVSSDSASTAESAKAGCCGLRR